MCDTWLTTGPVPALPLLSVQPQHRRGWGSLSDALAVGAISTTRLEPLLTRYTPWAGGAAISAVDVSVWPRGDAETRPGRALYYHSARHSAGQPIVAGWASSWIAHGGFAQDRWTAPLHARRRRRRPQEHAHAVAAAQIAAFLPHLRADGPRPWVLFDAGDAPVPLTQAVGDTPAPPCWSACVPGAASLPTRPRRRALGALAGRAALATRSPALRPRRGPSPPMPSPARMRSTARYACACACGRGRTRAGVRVRAWTGTGTGTGWHPKTHGLHTQRAARGRRPMVRGTLLLVEVSRLPDSPQQTRQPQALWLWWPTPQDPDSIPNLDRAWRADVRRFDLEHTFRFLKQSLNGTIPRLRHPEQADRWTWLVLLASTQLRLARPLAGDQPLPWQRPQRAGKLTP